MLNIVIFSEDFLKWKVVEEQFAVNGWQVSKFDTLNIDIVARCNPHLLLIDLSPPVALGLEFFRQVKRRSPRTDAIFISAYATMSTAVEAMKAGAIDFVSHPFSADSLVFLIKEYEARVYKDLSVSAGSENDSFHLVLGQSRNMRDVFHRAAMVSKFDTIVMVLGETGTGKEVLARSIHMDRAVEKPFAAVHLGNIPEELAEAELFGYEKGAFTGAYKSKPGKFEVVEDGTLFLDDIDDASPRLQTKLLRVLQEKEFERVGGIKSHKARCRIIISAKPDIYKMVQEGLFREDLYYRINVVPIKLPPLRKRKADIPLLTDLFIRKYTHKFDKKVKGITKTAAAHLMKYDYPGNIRELEHVIERLVCFSTGGSITDADIAGEFGELNNKDEKLNCSSCLGDMDKLTYNLYDILEEISEKYILWGWKKSGENAYRAAKLLGIPRTSFMVKFKKIQSRRDVSGISNEKSPTAAGKNIIPN
ncbi:MAG: sigma-54-dependent Fis family transcriptional regulator [bacterium]|nr:sigma-54-dependent Fis family transcriptional regulator [bacterium]